MSRSHSVALLGFSAFERSTLEAFFRLAARRSPSYVHVAEPSQAQIVLVDADSGDAIAEARRWSARSFYIGARVYIGAPGQPEPLGHMPRPINMMTLLRQLDGCVGQLVATPAAPAAPRVVELAVPTQTREPAPSSRHADNILVVDDSDIALRFMANCLGRFGFDVHLARSGEEALSRVAECHYEVVFMDVTMPGIDGYQTCKLIKKRPYAQGRRPPTVVMLTSRGGMVDKMRGTLSGCDAYLTKPLQQEALMKIIGDRLGGNPRDGQPVAPQATADTAY
jgi:two-component system, cell cycle response regulator